MSYSLWHLVFVWLIYFIIHSVFASSRVKTIFKSRFSWSYKYYRLIYNLFAVLSLVPVFYVQSKQLNHMLFFNPPIWLTILGMTGVLYGLYMGRVSFKAYRSDEFLGVYQMKNNRDFHPEKLNRKGLNQMVRHPLYLSGLIIIWSYFLISPLPQTLVSVVCITLYLIVGTIFEEKKLVKEFGESYAKYQTDVSMLIPFKRLFSKNKNTRE